MPRVACIILLLGTFINNFLSQFCGRFRPTFEISLHQFVMCVLIFQVYLTGMIPLAARPNTFKHVDFGSHYVPNNELRRFADKKSWRFAIFAHLEDRTEQLMPRLWQCVEANNEDRTAPSLD